MKKWFVFVVMAVILAGCSGNGGKDEAANGGWDYKEGYVIAKDAPRILVVRSGDLTELEGKTPEEFLNVAQPEAMWVSAEKEEDLAAIEVGDKVSIELEGAVAESYPAQATAKKISKIDKP
ncbi:YobA family protein [Paenibacillus sp. N4]|uniref:DUF3221 domain-containing protein n=1 Tax=Paenibacillus vietnamensis TaxID=2590547 RepID=UPI001CD062C5|nr:DUF3221 domain-containing protein [Paenibacillus vietnamensis]MCA0756856.1 YobA family protein [Paenibacillus vietnamensis]